MNQQELIDRWSRTYNRSQSDVRGILRELEQIAQGAVERGEVVRLPGVATIKPVWRESRVARNPQSGEPVHVQSRWRVRIKALSGLQRAAGRRRT